MIWKETEHFRLLLVKKNGRDPMACDYASIVENENKIGRHTAAFRGKIMLKWASLIMMLILLTAPAAAQLSPAENLIQDQQADKKGSLFGGRFFFLLKDGETFTGVIYAITDNGEEKEVVFIDGRRSPLSDFQLINCRSTDIDFPGDADKIRDGVHTVIMEDGSALYGEIASFRGGKSIDDRYFEFSDGRKIEWKKVQRIYLR